jgi:hypothetical protein
MPLSKGPFHIAKWADTPATGFVDEFAFNVATLKARKP